MSRPSPADEQRTSAPTLTTRLIACEPGSQAMSVFDEPKIDCHNHILDPLRFPYRADTPFRPAGQEIATASQINHVFQAYGVRNALLVQPNSGYGDDNRCLLDAIASSGGRFKGIAIVPHDIALADLAELKSKGI